MGQEAVEIDNKLVEAMRPFATRLCAIGVLPTRDVQTVWFQNNLNSNFL